MPRQFPSERLRRSASVHLTGQGFVFALIFIVAAGMRGNFLAAQDAVAPWGTLSGKIVLTGKIPDIPPENVGRNKDRPACLTDGELPADDNLVVGKKGGLRDVFAILTVPPGGDQIPVHPDLQLARETAVVLDNKNCRFVPHALFVQAGQKLTMKNSDEIGHNCHVTTRHNEVNLNLPPGETAEVTLDTAERTPGTITCDIHPWMDAVILVGSHPYVAITDSGGQFELQNVPAGTWQIQFWHAKFGFLRKLAVPKHPVDSSGRITVKVSPGVRLTLGPMELPAEAIRR